jgi:hypothetical protein
MVTGTYAGNGAPGRAITGLGFRPDVVIIKGYDYDASLTPTSTVLRTSTMTGDNTKPLVLNNALSTNLIQSLTPDGFTVGSGRQVNQNLITFFWAAFKANADLKVGTYVGDGTASHSVTGLGFSPEYVIVMSAGPRRAIHACSATPAGRSYEFDQAAKYLNQITALGADGFTVNHDATQPYVNESGVVYHYVAWNESLGKVKVGSYDGNLVDNRSITGVGFQPEYLIVKSIYNDDPPSNITPPPHQRMRQMATDNDTDFSRGMATNHLQAFETDGFQIGSALTINRTYNDCNADGPGCTYFYVAFNQFAPEYPPLGTTASGTTITVTAPNSFEMRFNTVTGGAADLFYDLAEDQGRTYDLAGGIANTEGFPNAVLRDATIWHSITQNENGAKLVLLEATGTRVRVRQEAFYEEEEGAAILAGVKGFGDFSVYPSGRMAWGWTQRATASVPYVEADFNLSVNNQASGPLSGWVPSSQSDDTFANPGTDDFTLLKNASQGVRTDFLRIMYRDWTVAEGHLGDADAILHLNNTTTQQRRHLEWRELTGGTILPGAAPFSQQGERWNFLVYFKPTNLGSTASPWLDPLATARSADYRGPDPLSAIGPGSGWNENTADADFFNESEAVYTLDLDPSTGLTFDMDGSLTTRYSPFFKIRHWRSFVDAPQVTLEGVRLTKDVDYRADVKPLSGAHFAQLSRWHSTLENAAAVTAPDIGGAGSVVGAPSFVPARYGGGVGIAASTQYVAFPTGDFDKAKGAVEFWYRATWNSADGVHHDLCGFSDGVGHVFVLEKPVGNTLDFSILVGGIFSRLRISAADYSWRADDWVHIRLEWDDTLPLATQQRILLNGVEPVHTDPTTDYASGSLIVQPEFRFGNADGDATFAPGLFDEIHLYSGSSTTPTPLANGGLTASANEYLADSVKDYPLAFAGVDAARRGTYFYLGADSRFHGLNVSLATAGAGVAAGAMLWEYWNGTTGAWADLEAVAGFTDQTSSFTKSGTVFWPSDPAGWAPYSVNGGPDL